MDLLKVKLKYRAEGNANLVLVLPQSRKVLRLAKTSVKSTKNELILDPHLHVAYIELLRKILHNDSCYVPEIVKITPAERERINKLIEPCRPADRLEKCFQGDFGLIFPDAAYLPLSDQTVINENYSSDNDTYCVEIKPKQGWIFTSTEFTNLFDIKPPNMCRYCSMQYLKHKTGKVSETSQYCPMDLFSGDLLKMYKALDALLDSPQNNLRIFKNGILVYGSKHKLMPIEKIIDEISSGRPQIFHQLIVACLLGDFEKNENVLENGFIFNGHDKQQCNNNINLPANSILSKILNVQLLAKENIGKIVNECRTDEKTYTYLKDMVERQDINSGMSAFTPKEKYMLGATCMDCSLMIAFQKVDAETDNQLLNNCKLFQVENQYFGVKITALDLDPKPDYHVNKYLRQTRDACDAADEYSNKII